MSFAVQLATDLVRVEPGTTVPVAVEVVNRSDSADRFEIEIEGIDPAWAAVPVPSFGIEPRETHTERFFLKPPRDTESLAGTYPFVVNIRSIESGEVRSVQGALEVKPYFNLSLDLQPKKGTLSPFSRSTQFQVTVMNLGNAEQTMQMFAADNDSLFAFEFDSDQIILGAGQQRTLNLTAAGTKSSLLANSRLQNFSVSARAVDNPALGANASGQIEQKALASPGAFLLILSLVAILATWVALWPKNPHVDSVVVNPATTLVGQPVQVHWKTSNATSVKIQIGNWSQDRQLPEGSLSYTPDKAGDFAVEVTAISGDRISRDVSKLITVGVPPEVPSPEIIDLSVDEKQLKLGQPFMLHYKFNDAVVSASLYPMQRELDVKESGIQLVADIAGKVKYTVKAKNAAGKQVELSVTVTVLKLSKAKIVSFEVSPLEFDEKGGTVLIDFGVTGAAKIELAYAGQKVDVTKSVVPDNVSGQAKGHQEIAVTADTTFKLIVYDDEGVAVPSTQIAVKVKKPETPDAAPDIPSTTGGAGH